MPEPEHPKSYPFEIPPEWKLPRFATAHQVTFYQARPREFFIDFASLQPDTTKPIVVSRVVVTKQHLIELIANLQNTLIRFDQQKGGRLDPSEDMNP